MKNRLVVLLSAVCLSVVTACGTVSPEETRGEPALQDPQTKAFYCEICPVAPGQVQEMSRKPVMDTVTGQYLCWPCDGSYCGDGVCQYPENSTNCFDDCGTPTPYCGDGACNGSESCSTCSSDCGSCGPYCGDGICNNGETCSTCSDCGSCGPVCGDGFCEYPETRFNCRIDCYIECYQEVCP